MTKTLMSLVVSMAVLACVSADSVSTTEQSLCTQEDIDNDTCPLSLPWADIQAYTNDYAESQSSTSPYRSNNSCYWVKIRGVWKQRCQAYWDFCHWRLYTVCTLEPGATVPICDSQVVGPDPSDPNCASIAPGNTDN